uniref:Uncharacterized protein n=1 Tax=Panstrongylus lignarius TaxID=156445 RepID=A0A224Y1N4_9HEMI
MYASTEADVPVVQVRTVFVFLVFLWPPMPVITAGPLCPAVVVIRNAADNRQNQLACRTYRLWSTARRKLYRRNSVNEILRLWLASPVLLMIFPCHSGYIFSHQITCNNHVCNRYFHVLNNR